MSEEAAVLEASAVESGEIVEGQESNHTTEKPDGKYDGRERTSFEKARIAELKRLAASETDPTKKSQLEAERKHYYDRFGKLDAYETIVPTVREARELKQTLDAVGGRQGIEQLRTTVAEMEQIDALLAAGDPRALDALFEDAPEGIAKLLPAALDKLAQSNPEGYAAAIAPHAMKYLDASGFPTVFDAMMGLVEAGKTQEALAECLKMVKWVQQQRKGVTQATVAKPDPELEKLRKEKTERESKESESKLQAGYDGEATYAQTAIDRHLKPAVAKLGLSKEQYEDLRHNVWTKLQEVRNADKGFIDTINSRHRIEGVAGAMAAVRDYTDGNVRRHVDSVSKLRYGHQLRNDAKRESNVTESPVKGLGEVFGKQPSPSEVDYGPRGKAVAVKAGYKNVQDMLLDGRAPLISGGIRRWRK